jgi:hypothetical protein
VTHRILGFHCARRMSAVNGRSCSNHGCLAGMCGRVPPIDEPFRASTVDIVTGLSSRLLQQAHRPVGEPTKRTTMMPCVPFSPKVAVRNENSYAAGWSHELEVRETPGAKVRRSDEMRHGFVVQASRDAQLVRQGVCGILLLASSRMLGSTRPRVKIISY